MKMLDVTFYLTPEVLNDDLVEFGKVCNALRRDLSEHFAVWPKFTYKRIPEVVHKRVLAGKEDLSPDDRMEPAFFLYREELGENHELGEGKGISCVYVGAGYGNKFGTSVTGKPFMMVSTKALNLIQTIEHEISHCCGVDEHSDDITSIMHRDPLMRDINATWEEKHKPIVAKRLARYACY